MPAKSQWILRLPYIIEQLRALPSPVIDRPVVEELFQVGRRQAIYLLKSFAGFQSGKTFLAGRLALIEQLERVQGGQEFREEHRRRSRFAEDLARSRKLAPGKKIEIPAAEDVRDRRLAGLPAGIHLKPGELKIEFSGTGDLLKRLFELSQAILNDYGGFQKMVEDE
jgi:hypothetical protein